MAEQPKCLHCHRLAGRKCRRWLCYVCHGIIDIRKQYPLSRGSQGYPRSSESPNTLCAECGWRQISKGFRGLCKHCYMTPEIRAKYPPRSKGNHRGHAIIDGNKGPMPLPEPTAAIPGSPEKIAVLEERARTGKRLWHPDDPKIRRRDGELSRHLASV